MSAAENAGQCESYLRFFVQQDFADFFDGMIQNGSHGFLSSCGRWGEPIPGRAVVCSVRHRNKLLNWRESASRQTRVELVDKAFGDLAVGINPPIPQEGPDAAHVLGSFQI